MDWQTETYTAWLADSGDLYYVSRALQAGRFKACVSRRARVVPLAYDVSLGVAMTRCEQHAAVTMLCAFFARCRRESVVLAEAV